MMCSLGRHRLEDDVPAPKVRKASGARTVTRAQLEIMKQRTKHALEVETGHLDPAQAAAQEQFALAFEPMAPGTELVRDEGVPDSEIPYYARMP